MTHTQKGIGCVSQHARGKPMNYEMQCKESVWDDGESRPCIVPGESARDGYCHMHDPKGKHMQNIMRDRPNPIQAKKRCKGINDDGSSCELRRERGRSGYCHKHDPQPSFF